VGARHSRPFEIIYESRDLIAVSKPSGLPVIAPDNSRSRNLLDLVSDYLGRGNSKVHAALVHRIDRETSGLVLFAKNPRMKKLLMDNWNELVLARRYLAVATGRMEGEGVFDTLLAMNRSGEMYQLPEGGALERDALERNARDHNAQRAITHWKALETNGKYTLCELELETGRKHQIRVQLAAAGHPVAGDDKYGDCSRPRGADAGRLLLHSVFMELEHPLTHEIIKLECPEPLGFRGLLRPVDHPDEYHSRDERKRPRDGRDLPPGKRDRPAGGKNRPGDQPRPRKPRPKP
jgi:23S rRNA pseudouridine1911/1915/1917 synthase